MNETTILNPSGVRNPTDLMDYYIDEIDGTLDTMVGEPIFTDAQVRAALVDIRNRCNLCIETIDAGI